MLLKRTIAGRNRGDAPPRHHGPLGSSAEAVALRSMVVLVLAAFTAKAFTTAPRPGLSGRSALVLAVVIAFVLAVLAIAAIFAASAAKPRVEGAQIWLLGLLGALTAASSVLVAAQPDGAWQLGPTLVGCFAGVGLGRRVAVRTLALAAVAMLIAAAFTSDDGTVASVLLFDALPWFLVFRLLREIRGRHSELEASRAAEAQAAAAAERGRLAREMHDVLAHSLSALALHLESTRLLARETDADEEVARAIEKAHHLTASGLREARRAIATARGEELPGPERIGALAEAFGQQSGLPVTVRVSGEERELAPDARLAVYRTAQEALTNVRRHATAERVEVRIDYLSQDTVLTVEDYAGGGAPSPAGLELTGGGYGLTGMRERAELLGGRLSAGPTGEGFRVELRLPVEPRPPVELAPAL